MQLKTFLLIFLRFYPLILSFPIEARTESCLISPSEERAVCPVELLKPPLLQEQEPPQMAPSILEEKNHSALSSQNILDSPSHPCSNSTPE